MKLVIRLVLIAAIALMSYVCWKSVNDSITFDKECTTRDEAVIQRLMDIRTAQVAFREINGDYTADFDSLIYFVNNGSVPIVTKDGELTEEQLKDGMTEKKAMDIISKGNLKDIKKAGLWDEANQKAVISRDTIYISITEDRFKGRNDFKASDLPFVPYGNGAKFELDKSQIETASGYAIKVFEAKTPYKTYLSDLDRNGLNLRISEAKVLEKYAGMQVGSIKTLNNNAGNWE